eukprot:TRINITY_DN5675_c0_g2_i1.p1 TRINITY_DN5675_c0_g2~~TRINITY_DN5675_c0_g2_i1.p1  ORF type:complete len:409 (+),score=89.19 TRINITY_DN5675_c0_g2_i1:129-1355(+)
MGCESSKIDVERPTPIDIVVVGGGIFGAPLVKNLLDRCVNGVRVTLIDPKDYAEVPYAMVQAPWDSNLAERSVTRFADVFAHPAFRFVLGTASGLDLEGRTVTVGPGIGNAPPSMSAVSFDLLVMCTGSRPRHSTAPLVYTAIVGQASTRAARLAEIAASGTAVAQLPSVALAGAGPTGTEFAGNISSMTSAKVTLYSPGGTVLPGYPAHVVKDAAKILASLPNPVTVADGKPSTPLPDVAATIFTAGTQLNTEWLGTSGLSVGTGGVPAATNFLVDGGPSSATGRVFACGDMSTTSATKVGAIARDHLPVLIYNVLTTARALARVTDRSAEAAAVAEIGKSLKTASRESAIAGAVVPIGPKAGVTHISGPMSLLASTFLKMKQKDYFTGDFAEQLGAADVIPPRRVA